jgi:predicted RNA-binding protein
MCESNAYLLEQGERKEVMRDVARILIKENQATLIGLLGERTVLHDVRLVEANLIAHAMIFERL